MKKSNVPNEGKIEIFCTHITVKGKIIYPKNGKYFHFWVEPKKSA